MVMGASLRRGRAKIRGAVPERAVGQIVTLITGTTRRGNRSRQLTLFELSFSANNNLRPGIVARSYEETDIYSA
jgi:hypothetical protein